MRIRIAGSTKDFVKSSGTGTKLRCIGFSQRDTSRCLQAVNEKGIPVGDVVAVDPRSECGRIPLVADRSLCAIGSPVNGPGSSPAANFDPVFRRFGALHLDLRHDRIQSWVEQIYDREMSIQEFKTADFSLTNQCNLLSSRQINNVCGGLNSSLPV